jgi:hypothetical protein
LPPSYFKGSTCPLDKRGYNRDGKRGYLQVNYGSLTDPRGCPVAVSVHDGNTSGCETLLPQAQRLRQGFGIDPSVVRKQTSLSAQEIAKTEKFASDQLRLQLKCTSYDLI